MLYITFYTQIKTHIFRCNFSSSMDAIPPMPRSNIIAERPRFTRFKRFCLSDKNFLASDQRIGNKGATSSGPRTVPNNWRSQRRRQSLFARCKAGFNRRVFWPIPRSIAIRSRWDFQGSRPFGLFIFMDFIIFIFRDSTRSSQKASEENNGEFSWFIE